MNLFESFIARQVNTINENKMQNILGDVNMEAQILGVSEPSIVESIAEQVKSHRKLFCGSIETETFARNNGFENENDLIDTIISSLYKNGFDAAQLYDCDIDYLIVSFIEENNPKTVDEVIDYVMGELKNDNDKIIQEEEYISIDNVILVKDDVEGTMENIANIFNCSVKDIDDDFDIEMDDRLRDEFHNQVYNELEIYSEDNLTKEELGRILNEQYDFVRNNP